MTLRENILRMALISAVIFVGACGKIDLPEIPGIADPDAPSNPPAGVVDDAAGFYVRHVETAQYRYLTHKGDTTLDSECTAARGELATCYVEAEELDLHFNGLTLQYNVPSDMCSYLQFRSYYYFNRAAGFGPALVIVDTDAAGSVGVDPGNTGTVTGPALTCPFDYTSIEGPNCCEGTYTSVSRTWDTTLTPPGYTISGTALNQRWGGDAKNCISGPAVDSHPKNIAGFPVPLIYYVSGTGVNSLYPIKAPIGDRVSNIYPSNYFSSADHGGGASIPTAVVNPYYQFSCLDTSHEVLSEIRVMVRDWNTTAAFTNIVLTPSNHGLMGTEPAPWDTLLNNDFRDWGDFLNTYPALSE